MKKNPILLSTLMLFNTIVFSMPIENTQNKIKDSKIAISKDDFNKNSIEISQNEDKGVKTHPQKDNADNSKEIIHKIKHFHPALILGVTIASIGVIATGATFLIKHLLSEKETDHETVLKNMYGLTLPEEKQTILKTLSQETQDEIDDWFEKNKKEILNPKNLTNTKRKALTNKIIKDLGLNSEEAEIVIEHFYYCNLILNSYSENPDELKSKLKKLDDEGFEILKILKNENPQDVKDFFSIKFLCSNISQKKQSSTSNNIPNTNPNPNSLNDNSHSNEDLNQGIEISTENPNNIPNTNPNPNSLNDNSHPNEDLNQGIETSTENPNNIPNTNPNPNLLNNNSHPNEDLNQGIGTSTENPNNIPNTNPNPNLLNNNSHSNEDLNQGIGTPNENPNNVPNTNPNSNSLNNNSHPNEDLNQGIETPTENQILSEDINIFLDPLFKKTNISYSDYQSFRNIFEKIFPIVKSTTLSKELEERTFDLIRLKLILFEKMCNDLLEEIKKFNKTYPIGTDISAIFEKISPIVTKFPSKQELSEMFKYIFKNELYVFGEKSDFLSYENIFKKLGKCELLDLFEELDKMQGELDTDLCILNLIILPYLINKHNQQFKKPIVTPDLNVFKNELGEYIINFCNDGNQCYGNSVLQMFINSRYLRNSLYNILNPSEQSKINLKPEEQIRLNALHKILNLVKNATIGEKITCKSERIEYGFSKDMEDPYEFIFNLFNMLRIRFNRIFYNDLAISLDINNSVSSLITKQLNETYENYIAEVVTISQYFIPNGTNPPIEYPYRFSHVVDGEKYEYILKGIIQYGNGVHYSYYLFNGQFIRISCTDDLRILSQKEFSQLEPYYAHHEAYPGSGIKKCKVSHAYYERSDLIQTNFT